VASDIFTSDSFGLSEKEGAGKRCAAPRSFKLRKDVMALDWKKLIGIGLGAAKVFTPDNADSALDVVNGIIGSPTAPNEDATKALAGMVDALAKEVKKLRSELDNLKKETSNLKKLKG
jgi:hypothetical protein